MPRGAGALRVFSPRTVESSTLRCTAAPPAAAGGAAAFQLLRRAAGESRTSSRIDIMSVDFDYVNHNVEEASYGMASTT